MIKSHWGTGDYPILLNPEVHELDRLEAWDTIRICVDRKNIGIASGHGNTHYSIIQMMVAQGLSNGMPSTFILFRVENRFYFNLEDVSGPRRASFEKSLLEYFEESHADLLRLVVQQRTDKFIGM